MDSVCESGFFMHDLQLYLDTHPDDKTALEMFKEACKQYEACREAFEACCYPLRSCDSDRDEYLEWDWFNGAWPSERI
jgi:spore coat protein JB